MLLRGESRRGPPRPEGPLRCGAPPGPHRSGGNQGLSRGSYLRPRAGGRAKGEPARRACAGGGRARTAPARKAGGGRGEPAAAQGACAESRRGSRRARAAGPGAVGQAAVGKRAGVGRESARARCVLCREAPSEGGGGMFTSALRMRRGGGGAGWGAPAQDRGGIVLPGLP